MVSRLKAFLASYLDRTAMKQESSTWKANILAAAGGLLTGAITYYNALTKAGGLINEEYSDVFASLMCVVALMLCTVAVGARQIRETTLHTGSTQVFEYSYQQPVRLLCKLCALTALALLPLKIMASVHDLRPIQSPFYGRLLTEKGVPVAGATLTAFTGDRKELTKGIFLSDDQGFYFLRTTRSLPRSGFLLANTPQCPEQRLELSRKNEVQGRYVERTGSTSPTFFEHRLSGCKD